jgi:putative oxidoreductase
MAFFHDLLILVARICISSLFLWAGMAKVFHWSGTVEYMESKKLPRISLLLPAAILMQILGGLSLLLGYYIHIGVIILILFMVPAAIKMHDFWNLSDPERTLEKTFFMKDVAVLGALLLLFATGAGRFSISME